jgi:hypothetical protein
MTRYGQSVRNGRIQTDGEMIVSLGKILDFHRSDN